MRSRIIAKILCFGLSLGLIAGMTDVSFAAASGPITETETAAVKDLFHLDSDGTYNTFTNYVDGYSLKVDQSMQVDMGYSGICAVLENDHKRIEIYKESLPSNVSQQAYITYSNQFLANTADHTKEYDTRTTINGRTMLANASL